MQQIAKLLAKYQLARERIQTKTYPYLDIEHFNIIQFNPTVIVVYETIFEKLTN